MVLAWHPVHSGEVWRKGCSTSSACTVPMLVYIKTALQEKKVQRVIIVGFGSPLVAALDFPSGFPDFLCGALEGAPLLIFLGNGVHLISEVADQLVNYFFLGRDSSIDKVF